MGIKRKGGRKQIEREREREREKEEEREREEEGRIPEQARDLAQTRDSFSPALAATAAARPCPSRGR